MPRAARRRATARRAPSPSAARAPAERTRSPPADRRAHEPQRVQSTNASIAPRHNSSHSVAPVAERAAREGRPFAQVSPARDGRTRPQRGLSARTERRCAAESASWARRHWREPVRLRWRRGKARPSVRECAAGAICRGVRLRTPCGDLLATGGATVRRRPQTRQVAHGTGEVAPEVTCRVVNSGR